MDRKSVPLFRLGNHHFSEYYVNIFKSILKTGQWTLGEHTKSLEKNFANRFAHKHAVGVSNGTNAITLLLNTLGPRSVWISDTTFVGVWSAAKNSKVPNIHIVKPEYGIWDITTEQWLDALSKNPYKPTCIIVTHLYGSRSSADIERLKSEFGVLVIEDMSQCHGIAPSVHSDAQIYSLYPTKNLGALGEAGIITTDNDELAAQLISNRFYGYNKDKSKIGYNGNNFKMDELQAAFVNHKIKWGIFDSEIHNRMMNGKLYLDNIKSTEYVQVPKFSKDCTFHLFPIWAQDRDAFRKYMSDNLIQTGNHYPHSITNMVDMHNVRYPNTSAWNDHVVTLPIGGYHTQDEIFHICNIINQYKGT